jgi:hypothetical protein
LQKPFIKTMKNFKLINNLAGWGVMLISFIVYMLTLEPSVSFWDCGEFLASSYKLQVGHPPGAPLFMIIGRVVSIFASGPSKVAFMVNSFSALASAATIMFLFWTIVMLAEKFFDKNSLKNQYLIIAAGVIGSLTFAFTDSFWFSAVEAEVYASSSLFTAIVFWAILKWERVAGEKFANRWIILIAYLVGLSIGVHLLNLLAIPAIALIWYFKKYKPTAKGIIFTMLISGAAIAFIMWGIIQGTPDIAQKFEVLFVNSFGLPYNSGLITFIILVLAASIGLIIYSERTQKVLLNTIMISFTLILLGFSTYAIVMIRSKADPPMDENNPENAYTLMKYLNRSQYGTTPILTGYYYNASAISMKNGDPEYFPKDGKYVKTEGDPDYVFDSRFKTFFPRMFSSQDNHISGYKMWGEIKGKPVTINGEKEYIPTFSENLRFFFNYQLNHMYFRYFMWNFSGRQNDKQGYGDPFNGNWLTGIGFIDKARLGHNGKQPLSMANPETMNRYYMLPFLLGMIGLFFHFRKSKKDFWVVMCLFFMTGIAIVLYLNQTPYQPRERDYAYAGSYYAFAIWIGLGVLGLFQLIEKYLKKYASIVAIVICSIIPILVLAENYDDHDRSGRYTARDFGKNYLNSCEKNAILFVYGDNDTFPVWYAQDVENTRPDVRICNVTLLNGDWYIDQMKRKVYDSAPLPINMDHEKYENNIRNSLFVRDDIKKPVELSTLMRIMLSEDPRTKVQTQGGTSYNYLPTKSIKITVDKQKVLATKTVPVDQASKIADSIIIDISARYLSKSDLAILNILANNNWERPIYLDLSVVNTSTLKLDDYLQNEGFAYRFVPIKNNGSSVNTDILYNRLMNQFAWGNIGDKRIFVDENLKRTTDVVQIKNLFYTLSDRLVNEGKNDKAKQVIEKLYTIMPIGMYDASIYDIYIASVWYKLKDNLKGDQLMRTVTGESLDKIHFYQSLGSEYIQSYQREVNREISLLKEVTRVADFSGRAELKKEVSDEVALVKSKANPK